MPRREVRRVANGLTGADVETVGPLIPARGRRVTLHRRDSPIWQLRLNCGNGFATICECTEWNGQGCDYGLKENVVRRVARIRAECRCSNLRLWRMSGILQILWLANSRGNRDLMGSRAEHLQEVRIGPRIARQKLGSTRKAHRRGGVETRDQIKSAQHRKENEHGRTDSSWL
jgi:hypothetical protein